MLDPNQSFKHVLMCIRKDALNTFGCNDTMHGSILLLGSETGKERVSTDVIHLLGTMRDDDVVEFSWKKWRKSANVRMTSCC